jgi:hypothetical protein
MAGGGFVFETAAIAAIGEGQQHCCYYADHRTSGASADPDCLLGLGMKVQAAGGFDRFDLGLTILWVHG